MDGKQLKNSILQWAIQGKLVPQNPKDEPAQKLLERIASARHSERSEESSKRSKKTSKNPTSRIYRENGIWYEQVGNAEPKDISEDIPFEIPENWAWTNINSIASIVTDGEHLTPKRVNSFQGYYLLSARNILDGGISLNTVDYVDETEYNRIASRCNPSYNDVLISCSGSIGRVAVVKDDNHYVMVRSAAMIRPIKLDPCYLMYVLQSPYLQEQIQTKSKQTAQANLFQAAIRSLLIPLPPLAEQKRIVAKLEQVLPLADEYGAAQEQLDKLNRELPEALKKSILQQAIQGKLVPQNPKDEPAQKLLERIASTRHSEQSASSASLRGAKATKQSKKSAPTSRIYRENGAWYEQIGNAAPKDVSEDIPFEIPENWTWCRMGDFISISTGLAYKKEDLDVRAKSYIRVLRGGNIDYGKWKIKDDDVLIAPQFVKDDLILKKGMFITPAVTSLEQMGKTALVEVDQKDIVVGGFVLMMASCFNDEIFLKYVLNFFQSYYYKQYCQSITNKSGQAFYNLSRQKLLQCLIPLPPLAEQKRIVAKLEQLFKVL